MNICGVIVEYNPLHNGHIYHIKKSREITNCDGVIAVMSGNFVQRGIPSLTDKWVKTNMALNNGIDLVLELPVIYSLSSAEFFAFGAISLLNNLGNVNSICFGSECGDLNVLLNISKILTFEPLEYTELLKKHLNEGLSYAIARNKALNDYWKLNNFYPIENLDAILNNSNNILGIEYCKSILKLKSNITPFTITRQGSLYNDFNLTNEFSSASAIRNYLRHENELSKLKNFIPSNVYKLFVDLKKDNYNFTFDEQIFPYIKYKILTKENCLNNLPDASEGLDNKIIKEIYNSKTLNELILNIKSKRYTYTRISRILTQLFLGFDNFNTKNLRKAPCPYARVLGFNEKGQKILKQLKSTCKIPIYTKIPKTDDPILKLDILSTKAYSVINNSISPNSDYVISPIILK